MSYGFIFTLMPMFEDIPRGPTGPSGYISWKRSLHSLRSADRVNCSSVPERPIAPVMGWPAGLPLRVRWISGKAFVAP